MLGCWFSGSSESVYRSHNVNFKVYIFSSILDFFKFEFNARENGLILS